MRFFILFFSVLFVSGCGYGQVPTVSSFDECVEAGNPVMESYPRQCRHGEQLFVEELTDVCEDQCGDGLCAEIVCLGIGCPCAETPESCPQDCAE